MNGYITTDNYSKDIRNGLEDEAVFSKVGHFSEEDFFEICRAAARINLKNLIVDITCVTEDALIQGLKIYRIQKSSTRIIIFAPGKKPGDSAISKLVNMGIYDIVSPEIPEVTDETMVIDFSKNLLYNIQNPSTYADAVRWVVADLEMTTPVKKAKLKREKEKELQPELIIKEKVIGSIVIAVTGVSRRTGTTHAALHISSYLAKRKFKVACVELVDERLNPKTFETFSTNDVSKGNPQGFHLKKIDFFNSEVPLLNIYKSGYDYIILDFGNLFLNDESDLNMNITEFLRADFHVITSCVSLWDYQNLLGFMHFLEKKQLNFPKHVLLNFSNDYVLKDIRASFSIKEAQQGQITFANHVFLINPLEPSEESERLFDDLLQDILPKDYKEKGFLKKLLKK